MVLTTFIPGIRAWDTQSSCRGASRQPHAPLLGAPCFTVLHGSVRCMHGYTVTSPQWLVMPHQVEQTRCFTNTTPCMVGGRRTTAQHTPHGSDEISPKHPAHRQHVRHANEENEVSHHVDCLVFVVLQNENLLSVMFDMMNRYRCHCDRCLFVTPRVHTHLLMLPVVAGLFSCWYQPQLQGTGASKSCLSRMRSQKQLVKIRLLRLTNHIRFTI